MIDKQNVLNLIQEKLQGTGYELITFQVNAQNEILVEVDKLEGVDVDFCATLNHFLVESLDAQGVEDYSLEVGSVSLTDPFKTKMQYEKHLNHDVEVLALDGKKYRGLLVSVDDDTFSMDTEVMVQVEGKKRKVTVEVTKEYKWEEIKYVKEYLDFK